jgi:hypothetical protein
MPSGKIPKFTKSRPFGVPQTPFLAKKGRYMEFTKDPQILNVVVERKLTTADNMYLCSVLDKRTKKSGTQIHAQRLSYGSVILDDIPENTVLHAFRVDNKWWISTGEESDVPTVDFVADFFDRANLGNLGVYWNNSATWRVYNQEALYVEGSTSRAPYMAKLSSHNANVRFSFKADHEYLVQETIYMFNNTNLSGYFVTGAFGMIFGLEIDQETGIRAQGWVRIQRYVSEGPLYHQHVSYIYTPAGSIKIVDSEFPITSTAQLKSHDSLLINKTENILTMTGSNTPFSGVADLGAIYQTSVGFNTYGGYVYDYLIQDNFKAWVSSIPEPPDESGHGRYINGQYVYSDKYHAGGEYNPNA